MTNTIDFYIRDGYDLTIGMIDRGPHEGWFKAELDNGQVAPIQEVGETPGEALKKLLEKVK